jgi:hypothetical protein
LIGDAGMTTIETGGLKEAGVSNGEADASQAVEYLRI